ncbi:MAG: hypothetical protein GQ534_07580 [Candidatus Delongbacteria bacterium]|nr:hypothetical protein [Candidatus Delongbacteria bacterium]
MKKILLVIITILFSVNAQALFEVKDAQDSTVFQISNDGMRVFNDGDTLMVISSSEIKAFINQSSKDRALSRSFSISTNTTGKDGNANVLEVTTESTKMREGTQGNQYTDFSSENIFIGLNSGNSIIDGKYNIFMGNSAGFNTLGGLHDQMPDRGFYNVFIGYESGLSNTWGQNNIFMGYKSGYSNQEGSWNVFIGDKSGMNSTGEQNTYIGNEAGMSATDTYGNSFIGCRAGYSNYEGEQNTFVGKSSGYFNYNGSHNTFLGSSSGDNRSGGDGNTIIGSNAGSFVNTNTSNNVFLGYAAGHGNRGSGNVFLGNQAGSYYTNDTDSNRLHIANTNTETPLIYGEFDNNLVRINGNFNVTGNCTTDSMFIVETLEIADMGDTSLGLEGDIIPYSSVSYDLGNNTATEHWDDVVGVTFINYITKNSIKDIKPIDSGLNKIMQLKPVTFKSDRKKFGLIPDEVEKIIPEVVISQDIDYDPATGKKVITETEKGMNYIELIPVLIKSIQEQQEIIEKQQVAITENKKLKAEIEYLRSEIEEIKKSLK